MNPIRLAGMEDLARIAEILIFNYRLNFYPIFRNDEFYFHELQVPKVMEELGKSIAGIWVYDDGAVKGFLQLQNREIKKLFVEPVLQGQKIGSALIRFAIKHGGADCLWALEKNERAIAFYQRHGFVVTNERKPEEDTSEYLVCMRRSERR